ncbi:hypothetical protein GOODEAATRI_002883 [Goodea atripinnis]|uniref:Uncharacterized protein n=1 Tax=Goodea atripinnis TaxID=208336 RepID=A0ABV0PKG9_9TELE
MQQPDFLLNLVNSLTSPRFYTGSQWSLEFSLKYFSPPCSHQILVHIQSVAPKLWNNLLLQLRFADSADCCERFFKKLLKTILFYQDFLTCFSCAFLCLFLCIT